ncbi:sensor histidine kinase [Aquimarina sp. U1-2]|uniref:sensor histidine kinase n=1 Tax=Aquimarina sp. U1-2 TaxID=2823141 RepID=UPI001AECCC44|nr:sensor histidine kinase [Aquimarina sp. U1-2]MBP2833488.1 sensor histidine kinase [Aquimarina sp. U1-2]
MLTKSFSQQDNKWRKALIRIKNYEIRNADSIIRLINDPNKRALLLNQINYIEQKQINPPSLDQFETKTSFDKVLIFLTKGDITISNEIPNYSKTFEAYQKALDIALSNSDSLLICFTTRKIIELLYNNRKAKHLFFKYFNIYEKYYIDYSEKATLEFYKATINASIHQREYINDYKKAIVIAKKSKNRFIEGKLYQLLGVNFNYFLKEKDSAEFYYKKANKIFKGAFFQFTQEPIFAINTNLGILYSENNQPDLAFSHFQKAKKHTFPKKNYLNLSKLSSCLFNHYRRIKNYDSAFYYNKQFRIYNDSLKEYQNAIALNKIEIKYETAEKEKENILLKTSLEREEREQQILWISSISLLILGSSIGLLVYKNTKRKQRIAEQEREIQIQKTEKLLKDQELAGIDAMLAGQEKERQRLANDLHDNLGSTLVTLKLHFNHLQNNLDNPKANNLEELYTKTDNLLDEAYQKVRTMAHEKNSGVMANQGLLPAIKNLAKKASNGDGLKIEVQDYGLEERLDNTLEIAIFRMIQELITNIIKHANAKEVHISLTNHDSLLNIIVEDDGKGFNPQVLHKKEGMGLKNIEKRVEHLEGTFEIDTTPGKGTNTIINIPI